MSSKLTWTALWSAVYAAFSFAAQASAQPIATYRGLCDASAAVATGDGYFVVGDDEAAVLSSLKRLLRREGYHILTAESGLAGLGADGQTRSRCGGFRCAHTADERRRIPRQGAGNAPRQHVHHVVYADLKAVTDTVNAGEG